MRGHLPGKMHNAKHLLTMLQEKCSPILTNTTQGLYTGETGYNWNAGTNNWENDYKSIQTNNADGNANTYLSQNWNGTLSIWSNSSFSTNTYNTNKWLIATNDQVWDDNTSVWVNSLRFNYTQNSNGYLTHRRIEEWNAGGSNWINDSESYYWYETNPFYTSIEEQAADSIELLVYPNPVSDGVLKVNSNANTSFQVFDFSGRLMQSGELQQGTNSILLNEAKGTYILRVGNSATQIVKQ